MRHREVTGNFTALNETRRSIVVLNSSGFFIFGQNLSAQLGAENGTKLPKNDGGKRIYELLCDFVFNHIVTFVYPPETT